MTPRRCVVPFIVALQNTPSTPEISSSFTIGNVFLYSMATPPPLVSWSFLITMKYLGTNSQSKLLLLSQVSVKQTTSGKLTAIICSSSIHLLTTLWQFTLSNLEPLTSNAFGHCFLISLMSSLSPFCSSQM